jgi:trehalose synthase
MTLPPVSRTPAADTADDGYSVTPVPLLAAAPDRRAETAEAVRRQLGGARIWHVNSTANGGGVAELLRRSIPAQAALGLPAGWLVSDAPVAFFDLTKRLHHGLHGRPAGGPLSPVDELYRTATDRQATGLLRYVAAGDLVVLHDPQTLGAAPRLLAAGVRVAWRSHIGTTEPNEHSEAAWRLLRPYLEPVPHCVFTMLAYAPPFVATERVRVITPSIDPTAPKNRDLDAAEADALLAAVGLTGTAATGAAGLGRTAHDMPLPRDAAVLLQISRWDPLKDMVGVLNAFGTQLARRTGVHLVLAGPDPADIPDDPEGRTVYRDVVRARDGLPAATRARVHLVTLSLADTDRNALAVNALQRRATVVSQKSMQEGFGLTVTEAMWKSRPVVASRIGGLCVQIPSPDVGVLVDPTDLRGFAEAVGGLLDDPARAARLGAAAHRWCAEHFLAWRELDDYLQLYLAMLDH